MTRVSQTYFVKYLLIVFILLLLYYSRNSGKLWSCVGTTLTHEDQTGLRLQPHWRLPGDVLLTQAINLPVLRNNVSLEPTVFLEKLATVNIWVRGWKQVGWGCKGHSLKKLWDRLLLWVKINETVAFLVFQCYMYNK